MIHRTAVGSLILIFLFLSCSSDGPRPRHVVLICLDTVRADRLGAYGYGRHPTTPALDRLAERSYVFEDASATAGWTKPSVPTLLTGVHPARHGVYEGSARRRTGTVSDVLAPEIGTMAEAFADNGYRTAAFIRNAQLRMGNGFEQGFDLYVDEAGDAADIRRQALEFLDEHAREGPVFLYLHILDAHMPYDVPDEAATRFTGDGDVAPFREDGWRDLRDAVNDGTRTLTEDEARTLSALYDGSIRYIDDELGRLFEGLESRGLADDTVISIVADHGEEFGEHGRLGHGHGLYENLLQVGWILRVPGETGGRVRTPLSLVDLYPTLLAASGQPLPDGAVVDGVNRLARPLATSPVFAEHKAPDAYLQSLREGRWKLVRRFEPPERAVRRLEVTELLSQGGRWEAEVERSDGRLRALQLKPRDEDPSEPVELKARVESWEPGGVVTILGGLAVQVPEDVRTTGAIRRVDGRLALAPGDPIKVGVLDEAGAYVATKLKGYEADGDFEPEIRGPVALVDATADGGSVRIGFVEIHFDAETDWKDVDLEEDPRMSRSEVQTVLERGSALVEEGFTLVERLYDLEADPDEMSPMAERRDPREPDPTDGRLSAMSASLDRLGRQLAGRRVWSDDDEAATLDDEALEALRELGYVR